MAERLQMKLQLTQNFTVIVSGHRKTRDYRHSLKIKEQSKCPCGKWDQTTDRLTYTCERLTKERDKLKKTAYELTSSQLIKET